MFPLNWLISPKFGRKGAEGLSTKLILLMLWSTLVLSIIEKTKSKWSMQIREYNLSLYFWNYIIARRPLCEHGKKEGKESCWTHHQNRIDFQREIDFLGHVCQWHTAQDPPTLQCLFAENVAETSKETKVEGIMLAAFFCLQNATFSTPKGVFSYHGETWNGNTYPFVNVICLPGF